MTSTLERTSGVLSHDLYYGPTESQLNMVAKLKQLQGEYAELLTNNPLFQSAVHTWVEMEHDDEETTIALSKFKVELDEEVEGMTEQEMAENPDADLHKMVKLRLEIAALKLNIAASEHVTSVHISGYEAA